MLVTAGRGEFDHFYPGEPTGSRHGPRTAGQAATQRDGWRVRRLHHDRHRGPGMLVVVDPGEGAPRPRAGRTYGPGAGEDGIAARGPRSRAGRRRFVAERAVKQAGAAEIEVQDPGADDRMRGSDRR